MAQHWVIRPVLQHLRCQARPSRVEHSAEENSTARSGSAQSSVGLSIRWREEQKTRPACILMLRQPASVDIHTQTGNRLSGTSYFHNHTQTDTAADSRVLTANGNGRKEAPGCPVEISHLIALHLQVESVDFRQEQGLLMKPCMVRIHNTTLIVGAWAPQSPVILFWRGLS